MSEALAEAAAMDSGADDGPVVVTDAADNVGGGTPGDTPAVLRDLLAHEHLLAPEQIAMLHIPDPEAVAAVLDQVAANSRSDDASGDSVLSPIQVGGKIDPMWGGPVTIQGAALLALADGPIKNCAPGGAFGAVLPPCCEWCQWPQPSICVDV